MGSCVRIGRIDATPGTGGAHEARPVTRDAEAARLRQGCPGQASHGPARLARCRWLRRLALAYGRARSRGVGCSAQCTFRLA